MQNERSLFPGSPLRVLTCVDSETRPTLDRVLQGHALLRHCGAISDLSRHAEGHEGGAAIVQINRTSLDPLVERLQTFRRRFATMPLMLLAASRSNLESVAEVAATVGAEQVACRDADFSSQVVELMRSADTQSAAGLILSVVDESYPTLDPVVRSFIACSALASREIATVDNIARAMSLSRRTMERRLVRAELPTAHALLAHVLVIRAAYLLADYRSTLSRVVAQLPFPDVSAVSRRFRRYAGFSPRRACLPNPMRTVLQQTRTLFLNAYTRRYLAGTGRPEVLDNGGSHDTLRG